MFLRILIVILIIYFIIRILSRQKKNLFTSKKQRIKTAGGASQKVERLTACPICGTYFQRARGVEKRGMLYCSKRCASKA